MTLFCDFRYFNVLSKLQYRVSCLFKLLAKSFEFERCLYDSQDIYWKLKFRISVVLTLFFLQMGVNLVHRYNIARISINEKNKTQLESQRHFVKLINYYSLSKPSSNHGNQLVYKFTNYVCYFSSDNVYRFTFKSRPNSCSQTYIIVRCNTYLFVRHYDSKT